MRRFPPAVVIAWLVALAPGPARGQSDAAVLERNADAVEAGRRGLEAFRLSDWSAAYQAFREAETITHSPVFLLYMARVRQRQGASAEALDLYSRITSEPLSDSTPDPWKAAISQAALEANELRRSLVTETATAKQAKPAAVFPVREASTRPVVRKREEPMPTTHKVALAAGAIGAAGLVLGATAGIVSKIKLDRLREDCPPEGCDLADKPKLDSVETWTQVANVAFVVAGTGFAAAGIFLWLVPATPTNGRAKAMSAGISTQWNF